MRREGGSFKAQWLSGLCPGEMKLHCEVEVVSRHLPTLGLRNRGKGVRAVVSLCQLRPPARGEQSGPHPACLLVSTLKDKRGTRYEVREALPGPGSGRPRASSPLFSWLKSASGAPERRPLSPTSPRP